MCCACHAKAGGAQGTQDVASLPLTSIRMVINVLRLPRKNAAAADVRDAPSAALATQNETEMLQNDDVMMMMMMMMMMLVVVVVMMMMVVVVMMMMVVVVVMMMRR